MALRFFADRGRQLGFLHIACHVKTGASHKRVGILNMTDEVVELAVAVRHLMAKVSYDRGGCTARTKHDILPVKHSLHLQIEWSIYWFHYRYCAYQGQIFRFTKA